MEGGALGRAIRPGATPRGAAALVAIGLFAGTLALYLPVLDFGFVRYDDHEYVASDPRISKGLSASNAAWALTAFHVGNWHPLTLLSHMTDVSLLGRSPGAHHFENALLHALNAVLVFLLLFRGTRRIAPAGFAAALFAVHPLHVESVAWISQRKAVLGLALLLASLLAYEAWVRRGGALRRAASLAALAGSLAAKPAAVVAPALLGALDAWPLGRFSAARTAAARLRLVAEKMPYLVPAAAAAIVTVIAQRQGSALGSLETYPVSTRLARVVFAYAWYPLRFVWPRDLSLFYPTDLGPGAAGKVVASAAFLVAAAALVILLSRRFPFLPACAAWYAIALAPVSGIVTFGTQVVADRYAYLPSIGVFAAAAWLVSEVVAKRSAAVRRGSAAAGVLAIVGLALVTRGQLPIWRDSGTLLRRGVERAPDNVHALINYGMWLAEDEGRVAEALPYLERATALAPGRREPVADLGWALARLGRLDEALPRYDEALRLDPLDPDLLAECGRVLARLGRMPEAEARLREALRLDPRSGGAHLLLGTLLHDGKRAEEAEPHLETAVALRPGDPAALTALGANLAALGRTREAVEALRRAAAAPGPPGDRARTELTAIEGGAKRDGP